MHVVISVIVIMSVCIHQNVIVIIFESMIVKMLIRSCPAVTIALERFTDK